MVMPLVAAVRPRARSGAAAGCVLVQMSDGKYQRLCKTAESLCDERQRQTQRMIAIAEIVSRLSDENPATAAASALRPALLVYGSRLPQPTTPPTDQHLDD